MSTREVLTVERDPWALELFKLVDGEMVSAGRATLDNGVSLSAETVNLTFALEAGTERPRIKMGQPSSKRVWWA